MFKGKSGESRIFCCVTDYICRGEPVYLASGLQIRKSGLEKELRLVNLTKVYYL